MQKQITKGESLKTLALVLLLFTSLSIEAKNNQKTIYNPVEKLQESSVKLLVAEEDITSSDNYQLNFLMDASDLLVKSNFPQQIKIKAYTLDETNQESLVTIINSSIFNSVQAKKYKFTLNLPETFSSQDLYFDVFDSSGELKAGFKQYLEINTATTEETTLTEADCDQNQFGDCQLKYILESLNFIASPSKSPETTITKESTGKYTISLPLVKTKNLRINNSYTVIESGINADNNDSNAVSLTDNTSSGFLEFVSEGVKEATMLWNSANTALEIFFKGETEAKFSFNKDGSFESEKIKLKAVDGLSSEVPEDGTIEFDGSRLYITKQGHREPLSEQGPPGPMGPPGSGGSGGLSSNNPSIKGAMNLEAQESPPASPSLGDIYHDNSPAICVYINGSWNKLIGTGSCAAGTDNDPSAFDFTDLSAAPGVQVESNTITLTGFDNAPISISGEGSPEYSIDGAAFTNSSGTINTGSELQLRMTSNGATAGTHTATITIGGVSDSWTVSSLACPDNFAFIPGSEGFDSFGNVDADYSGGWCVSQYEMTPYDNSSWTRDGVNGWHYNNSSGSGKSITAKGGTGTFPITQVTRNEAAAACSADLVAKDGTELTNGKLLTVYWWSNISQMIVDDGINWSGGSPGSGNLSRGNASSAGPLEGIAEETDATQPTGGTYYYTTAQGRSWRIGNGEESVYDWSGNVWEWFDDLHNNAGGASWDDIDTNTLSFTHDNPNGAGDVSVMPSEKTTIDTTTNGVGRIYVNNSVSISGTTNAAIFGGNWSNTTSAGVFASAWSSYSPSGTRSNTVGFRCIIPAQ